MEKPQKLTEMTSIPGNKWSRPARVILQITQRDNTRIILDGENRVLQVEAVQPFAEQPTVEFPMITQAMLNETDGAV